MQKGTSCLGQRTDDEGNRLGNVGSAEQGVPSCYIYDSPIPLEETYLTDTRSSYVACSLWMES